MTIPRERNIPPNATTNSFGGPVIEAALLLPRVVALLFAVKVRHQSQPSFPVLTVPEDHSDGRSDSDSDYKRSRAVTRRKSDRQLKIVPCGEKCADHPNNKANSQRHNRRYDSDSDSDYSSGEEYEKQRKHRNRKLLYTGLACVTTVAAANNIYRTYCNQAPQKALTG